MRVLTHLVDLETFMTRVHRAVRPVLLLDYDGTLAPFVAEREKAFPYPGVPERLNRIIRHTGSRVVIVTGRTVSMIDTLLGLTEPVEIWGSHGAECRLPGGIVQTATVADEVLGIFDEAVRWAERAGLRDNLEAKPAGVAFHWRGMASAEEEAVRRQVEAWWAGVKATHGVYLARFDGGLELRVRGIDKGSAVAKILSRIEPDCPVAYLGDDHTDEDAFAEIGRQGLKVLVRPELRETAADIWLKPPGELYDFLDRWVGPSA
jgi:trehalose-phosphatase